MTFPIQPDRPVMPSPSPAAKPQGNGPPRPGGTPHSRIQLDSSLRRWFSRNLGVWRSRRTYFFPNDEVVRIDMLLRVEPLNEPSKGEAGYLFTWWPEQAIEFSAQKPLVPLQGSMEGHLCGHQLHRNKGFLDDQPTRSQIRQVDEHEVAFQSNYQDWSILEHIRLIDQDRYRARSIYTWRKGVLEHAEALHEIRIQESGKAQGPVA
jgi:hypothetical protein